MIKFTYVHDDCSYIDGIEHSEMHISDEANIDDVCKALKRFLQSCGYIIGVNDEIIYEKEADKPNEKLQEAADEYHDRMGKMQLGLDMNNPDYVGAEYDAYLNAANCPCTNCQELAKGYKCQV